MADVCLHGLSWRLGPHFLPQRDDADNLGHENEVWTEEEDVWMEE